LGPTLVAFVLAETVGNIFLLVYSIAVIYLFVERRYGFIWHFCAMTSASIVLAILDRALLPETAASVGNTGTNGVIGPSVVGVILIVYTWSSDSVKARFCIRSTKRNTNSAATKSLVEAEPDQS
jgi:hypothetical protein